ncbi:MAG: hypothetical protein Q9160_001793 [Pyrenula sp. 1 TL-2023]
MIGLRVPHPPSTNFFDESECFEPVAKKRRIDDHAVDAQGSGSEEERSQSGWATPKQGAYGIKEKLPATNEIDPPIGSQTDLETSLPPVKTDKEAIEAYEAYRAGQDSGNTSSKRSEERSWQRGRSSIYVDAFTLALDTVLMDESHLFNEAELAVFKEWSNLSYESQYLYVRLFLRKTSAWHRVNRLRYHSDIADLDVAVGDLQIPRDLPSSSSSISANPSEIIAPESTTLGNSFTFAEGSEKAITSLEEASSLLMLEELKGFARDAKVKGKNKKELLHALRRTSGQQTGLGFMGLKRSDTEDSEMSEPAPLSDLDGDASDNLPLGTNRDAHFTRKILDHTGRCIRLSLAPLKLFERVHLVFYRSTEWTEKSLTTIILAKISRRNFPSYLVSRSATIFPSRELLLEFEASIRVQFKVDNILEFNGTPGRTGLEEVKSIFEQVYPRWRVLLAEEQQKEDRIYDSGEGAYLRRFSPAWVYTRIIHKGLFPLGRFKEHKREHEIIVELLNQRLFHPARRGAWYQRKALLEEHYMHALMPLKGQSPELQKRHWKRIALQTCEDGLTDPDCHLIYHYDLQKRIRKLEKSLNVPKREQHDFGHVSLAKPSEHTVEGIRIEREETPSRGISRRNSDGESLSKRGNRTVWIDEREGGGECSVESMCLSWYREHGWKGFHCEGGLIRTLFGYLFYDVLFAYVPNVFQTEYQTCPLDLFTDAFYPSRISEINRRLVEISNGGAKRILTDVHSQHYEIRTCCVGIDWDFDLDDLLEVLECFKDEALATVCKVMAQEYQQRGGGIPDLFLWHNEQKKVMFVEVKSENDRLSDTQRLWIHVLNGAGVKVELCHAKAKEVRIDSR